MKTALFNVLLDKRLESIKSVLGSKAKEYASGDNRFHNFDVAARIAGTTPEKALMGMMLKHEVSVRDLVNNPENATIELIDEKIGDNVNYLILLEGLLKRRINE